MSQHGEVSVALGAVIASTRAAVAGLFVDLFARMCHREAACVVLTVTIELAAGTAARCRLPRQMFLSQAMLAYDLAAQEVSPGDVD